MKRNLIQEYEVSSWSRVTFEPDEALKTIEAKIKDDPYNAQLYVEKGLALAASSLYREAEECYSQALALDPFNCIIWRHRGHRMLSQWRFQDACADFTVASKLMPDKGVENWNILYHLGLSHFLLGEYEQAAKAYQACLDMSTTDDEKIAVCDWYYMTSLRLGDAEKANQIIENVKPDFDPGENTAYFRRLLMYKGLVKPEEVLPADLTTLEPLELITMGFGLSNYYFYNGEIEKSNQVVDLILKAGNENECYFAFGYLAALVDKTNRSK